MKIRHLILLALLPLLSVNAQNFTDNFKNESINDVPTQWRNEKGIGLIGELDGKKVIKLDRDTFVKPRVNGQDTNYLGDAFTIEFDAFFDENKIPTRQSYIINLWEGTGVHGENGKHTDPYFIYRHGIYVAGSFKNTKKIKELAVVTKTWRHIKVDYAQNTLKIFIDDQLIHHQPDLFYKPTMVSIGATNVDGPSGITNFSLIGETEKNLNGLKIIVIVDNQTQKVKNIEMFESMQNMKQVTNRYPKSSFYAGMLNGKYAVRTRIIMDIEKPDWNKIISTGNYSIEPEKGSVISLNIKEPYNSGDSFLPLKGSRSFLTKQDMPNEAQFMMGDKINSGQQFASGNAFNFGTVNTKILQNKDGVVLFKAESSGTNDTNGPIRTFENTGDITDPVDVTVTNPGIQDLPQVGPQKDDSAVQSYLNSKAFQSVTKGNVLDGKGYRRLATNADVSSGSSTKEREVGTNKDVDNNICVTKELIVTANSDSYAEFVSNGTPDWMKPGVFFKASEYLDNIYTPVEIERNPITLYIDLPGANPSYITVDDPTNEGKLQNAISQLQSRDQTVSLSVDVSAEEIHSEEELGFKLSGKYSNAAGISAKLGLDFNNKNSKHYYMLNVTQAMFTIDVDNVVMAEIFKDDSHINFNDLIYVSRVTYGRRAIVVVESSLDFKSFKAGLDVSLNSLVHDAELNTELSLVKSNENFKMKALLYGGSPEAGFKSIDATIKNQKIELSEYLLAEAGNARYAKPIAYQLKNTAGESLGMSSAFKQTVKNCKPPLIDNIKLKVTLTDLLCIEERDKGENPDDYGLQQAVYYKANNTNKIATDSNYKKYAPSSNCNLQLSYADNLLTCTDKNNQIQIEKSRVRIGNINNSVTFDISPEEFYDNNAVFAIHTWLKEYTGNEDSILYNSHINVKIQKVISQLLNNATTGKEFQSAYYDSAITSRKDFNNYGNPGDVMWLASGAGNSLEGPIRLGGAGKKATTWINFEIVK